VIAVKNRQFLRILLCALLAALLTTSALAAGKVLNHKHSLDEGTVVRAPTCIREGVVSRHCTDPDCAYSVNEVLHSLGHHMVKGEVLVPLGCSTDGVTVFYCDREGCGYTLNVVYPSIGHNMKPVKILEEATCTEAGHVIAQCTRKGCSFSRDEYPPALGHDWGEAEIITVPEEKKNGLREFTCRRCGAVKQEKIPALSTNFKLELISGELFTFEPRGRSISIRADGELNFAVNIKSGWRRGRHFEVTAKGAEIREEPDGTFTIFNVEQNTSVLVSGIVQD